MWLSRPLVNAILVIFVLYTLLPLTWLVIASTKSIGDLFSTNGFALAEPNFWNNIVDVFTMDDGIFSRWLINTVLYAVGGATAAVLVSFLAGYAFDKFDFRWRERWFGLVLVGVLVPAAVTTLPLYLLASAAGLVNTFWAVFLPLVASPFGVYMARIFVASYVPTEIIDAARVDGAGEFRIFFRIAIPMAAPGVTTLFLMLFSGIWNNFFLPLVMLTDTSLFPVSLGLFTWNGLAVTDPFYMTLVLTGSLIAIIPVILLFLPLQRFWKAGLGEGALK